MKDIRKKNLLKKLPPQPVAPAEQHQHAAPAAGQPVIAETAKAHTDLSRLSRLPRPAVGPAADDGDDGDEGDDGDVGDPGELSEFKDAWDRYLPPISGKLTRRANHELDTNHEPEPGGLKTSASNPQAPNSCEINASCGIAE